MSVRVAFPLYLITDRRQVAAGHSLLSATEAALRSGVPAVQLREKDLPAGELFSLAKDMRALTRNYHALLLINDRLDVAMACDADGVHLGEDSLPADIARRILGPEPLIGVSTHSLDGALAAARCGADFLTFGPVFATPSKAVYGPPKGLRSLRDICRQVPLPVYALGGIRASHQEAVLAAGAAGIALISAILATDDPGAATCEFGLSST